ncbi:MAG: Uma2 family endonuclease [Nocardioides sp.]|nr:Uma2 family endonuclease [Nocardioides sp.]
MTAMPVVTPEPARKLTRADWEAMPEHRGKVELLDGVIVEQFGPGPDVTGAKLKHQKMLARIYDLIRPVIPAGWLMLFPPFDVFVKETVVLEPDLIVAPEERFLEHGLEEPPTLVVEALSPSTRQHDVVKKFNWFAEFGVQYVWFADPTEPSVIMWELVEGRYVEMGEAVGDQTLTVERPFATEVNPKRLVE